MCVRQGDGCIRWVGGWENLLRGKRVDRVKNSGRGDWESGKNLECK